MIKSELKIGSTVIPFTIDSDLVRNAILKELCAITPEQVLTLHEVQTPNGAIEVPRIGGIPTTSDELMALKSEAEQMRSTRLWQVITHSVQSQAFKHMHEIGTSWEDTQFARAVLYAVKLQNTIMDKLYSYTPTEQQSKRAKK